MKKLLLLFMLLFISIIHGQLTNSQKITYASFYNASGSTINFTTKELSFEYFIKVDSTEYNGADSHTQTANKIHAIFPKIGITETDNFLKLNDLDFSEKNGFLIGVKYIYSVNEFFNYTKSKYRPQNIITGRFEITGKTKVVKVLDQSNNRISKENPFTLNVDGGLGTYLFWLNNYNIIMYPQINLGSDILTYNEKSLAGKFINSSLTNSTDGFIIVNDDFEGVVGEYKDNVQRYYAGASMPFLFDYQWKKIPKFMLTPYTGFVRYSYQDMAKYNLGGSVSFLSKNFIKAEDEDGKRELTNPSFLNFGIDWIFQDGKTPSKPNIYISGGINF